jgi:hypothetical protein
MTHKAASAAFFMAATACGVKRTTVSRFLFAATVGAGGVWGVSAV